MACEQGERAALRKMWYTSLLGITSRHTEEEAFHHHSDFNTMITEQFYRKSFKKREV